MKPGVMWAVFGIGCALQWGAPLAQIRLYERVKTEGRVFTFRCEAPDPYDMLRGRFLAVRAMPDAFDSAEEAKFESGEPLYAVIEAGADGLAAIRSLAREMPAEGACVKVTCAYSSGKTTRIVWPFDRFYLNEKIAPQADEWYRKNVRAAGTVTAEVRVLDGRAVLVDLKHDGRSFREILAGMAADK